MRIGRANSETRAPHCPKSHDFLGPVYFVSPRSASSSDLRLSTVKGWVFRLTFK
ncbi:hypothetical protein LFM09_44615 [Lentzea alba]|uniref:hypothetical protein n=1 Tax=Lentzea alba TaxID=2714351 RepID=UPI0039BFF6AF